MPTTTNLQTLTINHVASQEVYDAMVAQNKINENELYLIPGDISIATDNTPGGTENSNAVITSGAAYAGFQTKANKENAIYFVKGTQTASTNAWTGVLSAVNNLYDGLTIAYFLPYAGTSSSATLTLILGTNIETAAEPVYYTSTSRATTHYGAGSVIYLTWVSNTTTGYSAVGSATGRWLRSDYANSNTVPAAYCSTAAGTAAKTATHSGYVLKANSYNLITITKSNTAQSALTLNINSTGAKPIYINGAASSRSNYTLPAGTYLVFYDGTRYYFRTDGKITGNITGDAATLNGRSDYVTIESVAPETPTVTWGQPVSLGKVANKEFAFTMPSNPDTNTTYTLSQDPTDGHKITLTPSPSGSPQTITIPDNNTNYYHKSGTWDGLTYTADNTNAPNIELAFTIPTGETGDKVALGNHTHAISLATSTDTSGVVSLSHGGKYKLTAGGESVVFTTPADNDTYIGSAAFSDDTASNANKPVLMTLATTGTSSNIEVTANIPKVSSSSAGVAPKGAAVSSQTQSTKFLREDGTWAAPSYTINTNTDTLVKQENSTANSTLRVLLSHDANDTTTTNSSYKSGNLTFNPSSGTLTATNLRGALTSSQVTTALGFTPYTKTEVNNLIASVFHYKGTKATVGDLPSSSNTTGDVWHITADGSEYVWNGSAWEELGTVIDLSGYAQLSGANFTGPVNFGDSVSADDLTAGQLMVTGNASFTNNINANTINGVEVGSNPKFTDTVYTHPTYTSKSSGLYKITVDGTGHVSAATAVAKSDITGLGIPGSDTNTATAADNILDGSNSGTQITYAPYSSQQSKLSFDTSSTNPSRTDRLNLNGYLYATKLYSGGSEVLTSHQSLANYKTKQSVVSDPTASSATSTTFIDSISQNANGEITVTKKTLPTYNNYSHPTYDVADAAAKKIGRDSTGHVVIGNAITASDVGAAASSHTHAWSDITNGNDDLKAIEDLTGTSGFLKKTAANTWSLDTTTYVPTTRTVNGHALSSNVSVTASDVGLGNLTNNKQIKGLSSGTTSGHIVTWGSDGYTVADSGKSFTTATPTSSSTDSTIPTSKAVWAAIAALDVDNITGFDPGATLASLSETDGKISATFQDIEITASQVSDLSITLNGDLTTVPSFYAPVDGGSSGHILKANGNESAPTWIEAVPVTNGGTGMTAAGDINAVVISNSTSTTGAMQTVSSGDGAFYATGVDAKPQFGTLPVAQGGTGATTFTSGWLLIGNGTSAVGTRAVTNNTTNTSITNNNTNIPTMNTIYYGLAQINGASQNRGVSIYAPITTGTNGQTLVSSGSGAPTWASKSLVQIVRW